MTSSQPRGFWSPKEKLKDVFCFGLVCVIKFSLLVPLTRPTRYKTAWMTPYFLKCEIL